MNEQQHLAARWVRTKHMDSVATLALLGARLLLAFVFIVAGVGKLLDLAGSRRALAEFGVPASLANPLGVVLPLAELGTALALIPLASARWGAGAALALLISFVAGITLNLALGRRPDCHCFGQLHSVPAGWGTLLRNALLAGVAGLVIWQGDRGDLSILTSLAFERGLSLFVGIVVLAAVGGQSWFVFYLLRQHGRILLRLDTIEEGLGTGTVPPRRWGEGNAAAVGGLPVGVTAPSFSLPNEHGRLVTLDSLRGSGKPVMLVFSAHDCPACVELLPEVAHWERAHRGSLIIAVLDRVKLDQATDNGGAKHGLTTVLLQTDGEVARLYDVAGTPSAVIVRPDGTIGSALAPGAAAIRALLARTVRTSARLKVLPSTNGDAHLLDHDDARVPSQVAQVGEQAPTLKLPDLAGRVMDLDEFRGSKTLLLFWNPSCGFCNRMLDDLKSWENNRPDGAPQLLVISRGSAEDNAKMGLRSPVLIDNTFAAGMAFGASGTPSAVLITADGTVGSSVVVGAQAVLMIARGAQITQPASAPPPAPVQK
jgi:peroxiredoxin